MMFNKFLCFCGFLTLALLSCSKDKQENGRQNVPVTSKIVYIVNGTHFKLNYIDSNSVFQKDQVHTDRFRYEFNKGSGASIGISIFLLNPSDQIFSWQIYIDDKLYANAFSEGGAYLSVPYH